MVVCRFFLQGNCKYGNNCWNEHPSGGNQGYSVTAQRQLFGGGRQGRGGGGGGGGVQNQNPYKWTSQDSQQQQQQNRGATNTQQLSAADIVKALATEVSTTWEGGNMWPFSCIGFEKEMPSLPGFTDMSMEEMRFEAYEALKKGSIQPYIQKVEAAFAELTNQRQELKNPSMSLKQKLISFVDNCRRKKTSGTEGGGHVSLFSDPGSSGGLFGNSGGSNDLFGQSAGQSSTGLFGNSGGSTFGQSGTTSLFGQNSNQSGFGQAGAQSSTFGQVGSQSTLFGQTGSQPTAFGQSGSQSLFGQSGTQSGFGQTGLQPSAFGQSQSAFGQASQSGQQSSGFGQAAFGQSAQPTGLFGKPVSGTGPAGDATAQTLNTGLFGKPDQSAFSAGTFSTQPTAGPTTQNPFGPSPATPANNLIVGNSTTTGGLATSGGLGTSSQVPASQPVQESSSRKPSSLYTPMDKLSPEEIEQFKAQTFTIGLIPTKPPPKELCF